MASLTAGAEAGTEIEQIYLDEISEISLLDPKGRELEKYDVPNGAVLKVEENQEVGPATVLCEWDPYSVPILGEKRLH